MLTTINDFTLSKIDSELSIASKSNLVVRKPSSFIPEISTFDSPKVDYFDLGNVFETATDKVRRQVKLASNLDSDSNSDSNERLKFLDLPSLDLLSDVDVLDSTHEHQELSKPDFKVDYFPGWEPIITPSGGRIYSARRMTNKQRALIEKRLRDLNNPKPLNFLERTKSFLFPKKNTKQVKGRIDTSKFIRDASFIVDSFQFSNGELYINLLPDRFISLETFLRCYAVNNVEVKELFTLAKNLLFRGVSTDNLLLVCNRKLLDLKITNTNLCYDKYAIAKSKLLKSKVSECDSKLRNYISHSKSKNPNLVTTLLKDIIDLTTYTTHSNEIRSQGLECVDFFLSKCVEGVLESKSSITEKIKSSFLFRGFKAFRPKGSMVQEFAYWLQQYAIDPTNQRVASMFAQYQAEFKKQITKFISSKSDNSSSLISSLCCQLISSLKK